MKATAALTAILTLCACASAFAAGNPEHGKALHDKNCVSCHKSEVYTRADRKIASLDALADRIKFCEAANKLKWNDAQVADVASYLNKTYYKFK